LHHSISHLGHLGPLISYAHLPISFTSCTDLSLTRPARPYLWILGSGPSCPRLTATTGVLPADTTTADTKNDFSLRVTGSLPYDTSCTTINISGYKTSFLGWLARVGEYTWTGLPCSTKLSMRLCWGQMNTAFFFFFSNVLASHLHSDTCSGTFCTFFTLLILVSNASSFTFSLELGGYSYALTLIVLFV